MGSVLIRDVMAKQAIELFKLVEQSERIGEVRQAAIYRKHAMRICEQYGIDPYLAEAASSEDTLIAVG